MKRKIRKKITKKKVRELKKGDREKKAEIGIEVKEEWTAREEENIMKEEIRERNERVKD